MFNLFQIGVRKLNRWEDVSVFVIVLTNYHWILAPVCVGPYSQTNTLRSALHFLAGQIGLKPSTMELRSSWTLQLEQCWRNVASVLDALDGSSLENLFSTLVYVIPEVYQNPSALDLIQSISNEQIRENGSIVPGMIDSTQSDLYGGYEDEGTWLEMQREKEVISSTSCPLLLVSIHEMPKLAAIEIEVTTITQKLATMLERRDIHSSQNWERKLNTMNSSLEWDTGHSISTPSPKGNSGVQIDVMAKVIGHRCAASVLGTASADTSVSDLNPTSLLSDLFSSIDKILASARSGLSQEHAVNVRLFYHARRGLNEDNDIERDDGIQWRASLQTAVASWNNSKQSCTATTVVPVQGINLFNFPSRATPLAPFIAMQVLFLDPVHMETEQVVFNGDN